MAEFKITVDRKMKNATCTQGYLAVNDKVIAYSLEIPDLANANDISSIPHGGYPAFIRTDGARGWRVELRNVPGRDNIQIHVGNDTGDTTGCILIGKNAIVDNCTVTDSKVAMNDLQNALLNFSQELDLITNSCNPIEIIVEIKGV